MMLQDHFRHHRHYFLEHLAALLCDQLVGHVAPLRIAAIEETEIVADVVGEAGLQFAAEDRPCARWRDLGALDQDGDGGVAENEVRVAVAKIEVTGAIFPD